jgi:hypothetical protein
MFERGSYRVDNLSKSLQEKEMDDVVRTYSNMRTVIFGTSEWVSLFAVLIVICCDEERPSVLAVNECAAF